MDIAPIGTFTAFSTAPGRVAYDGAGDYSPFAEAFAHEVSTTNESIGDMMINVRVRVKDATEALGEPQITYDESSLLGKFWFNPPGAQPVAAQQPMLAPAPQVQVAKATPTVTSQAPPPVVQQTRRVNCSAGPHEFPLQANGYDGQVCHFSTNLRWSRQMCVGARRGASGRR